MNKLFLYLGFLSLCFLFCGCPYESDVPIDLPGIKLNPKLLGIWKSPDHKEVLCKVSKQDEYNYRIELFNTNERIASEQSFLRKYLNDPADSSEQFKKTGEFYAYMSLINGSSFLNIRKIESGMPAGKYYLCKLETRTEGMLLISEITDRVTEQFASWNDLRRFIASNMKNSFFFNRKEFSLINEDQIISLSKDSMKKEMELQESRAFNSLIVIALILVVVVSVSIWLFISGRRKTERLIFEKKEYLALFQGQDSERKRIASDLHDRLGSMLATVKVYFSSLEENPGLFNDENRAQYERANNLLDEACDEVRSISHDLASDVLVKSGLLPALHNLKEVVSKSKKIKLSVLAFGLETRLDNAVEITLYRIIQEMIGNILKHSEATEVSIQLNRYGNNLNVMVEDNGIGFKVENAKEKNGMGLKNMEARVRNLNGRLAVDTGRGKGTTMIIDIPV